MSLKGSCNCSGVQFELTGEIRNVVLCHCKQCQKTSGHVWAATQVPNDHLNLLNGKTLTRYRFSEKARRGFCSVCGASLFYERDGQGKTAIGAGTLDGQTNLSIMRQIYVKSKADYYDMTDTTPQFEEY